MCVNSCRVAGFGVQVDWWRIREEAARLQGFCQFGTRLIFGKNFHLNGDSDASQEGDAFLESTDFGLEEDESLARAVTSKERGFEELRYSGALFRIRCFCQLLLKLPGLILQALPFAGEQAFCFSGIPEGEDEWFSRTCGQILLQLVELGAGKPVNYISTNLDSLI